MGKGPTLLENKTYRRRGHYEGDPQNYRDKAEGEEWEKKNDPIDRFVQFLRKEEILTDKLEQEITGQVEVRLREAVAFAEASPSPEPEEALEDLFVT
jgi:pyruvate dehydrogenase E1 component alpha subunit